MKKALLILSAIALTRQNQGVAEMQHLRKQKTNFVNLFGCFPNISYLCGVD
ncbi:hypothetical protein [Viscerimonas tarda]